MRTRFPTIIFLVALIGVSALGGYENCETDIQCETDAALRCFVLCEG
jgi:hypothetical protein